MTPEMRAKLARLSLVVTDFDAVVEAVRETLGLD